MADYVVTVRVGRRNRLAVPVSACNGSQAIAQALSSQGLTRGALVNVKVRYSRWSH